MSTSISRRDDGLVLYLHFDWEELLKGNSDVAAPDGAKIKVCLHFPDGSTIEPVNGNLDQRLVGNRHTLSKNSFGSFYCTFPWGANEMHEAWIQVVLPSRTYWLAVPYGFTRDPKSPTFPTSNDKGQKFAPEMNKMTDSARIVDWKNVYYDVGKIQNDLRLALFQSNPFDAFSKIMLYNNTEKKGWQLHSPRTATTIQEKSGHNMNGYAVSIRREDSKRVDEFSYSRNGIDDGRDWGFILITVGDHESKVIIPSSLFRYAHGKSELHPIKTRRK